MDETALRADMIESLEHRLDRTLGEETLAALQRVPRETFVPDAPYSNRPSEVHGSRALAPTTVVRMVSALSPTEGDETLVVGAGVGYTAAILAEIVGARHVHAIDIDRELVALARSNLASANYDPVLVDRRDGSEGLPEYAPFDRILLEAAAVRPPRRLLSQLTEDGRLVFPRGTGTQTLVAVRPDRADRTRRTKSADSGGASVEGTTGVDGSVRVLEEAGPLQLRPLLADGERGRIERNRTRREDAELSNRGYFAKQGWEQEWVNWDDHR
ncbi:protein-L-isoaspartate O-methyltransferase [Halopenitus sp. H-Gu1]|uniref:protein-L-isoaspartate O-methyltransferase family protein n=1 Tax=Halopenitus sp. H-Gu1 TaxID=3242697 RepID=UPI00359D7A25